MSPAAAKPNDPLDATLELIKDQGCFSQKGAKRRQIFEFLLSDASQAAPGRSRADVLRERFWPQGERKGQTGGKSSTLGPDHDRNAKVRGMIRYIREDLNLFFKERNGKLHPWALEIDPLTWDIKLVPNRPRQQGEELLREFWLPHLHEHTTLLYPTPPFFEDRKKTFLRNPRAWDEPTARRAFSYLNCVEFSTADLRPAYQWTPIGAAVSMVRIAQCLQSFGQHIDVTPLDRKNAYNPHLNIILVGLPSSFSMVSVFERNLPIQTDLGMISVEDEYAGVDDPTDGLYSATSPRGRLANKRKTERAAKNPVLWGSVTRRGNTDPKFALTVIAGTHNRVVQEIGDFLCNGSQLLELARMFDPAGIALPKAFQARFRVEMYETDVGFQVSSIGVDAVRIIRWNGSVEPSKSVR